MALSVSIIVPVYNVEEYIEDCFQSIASQTYTGPMECLFIDDCGTDRSIEKLNNLIEEYDGPIEMRIFHHEKNRGLSAARNTGMSIAKGDYIFLLDSDDQLYPESIERLSMTAVRENLPDMVLGSLGVTVPTHTMNRYKFKYESFVGQPKIAKAFLDSKLFCIAPNRLLKLSFIVDNELWFKEGIIHEDNLWSCQSYHLAKHVVTIPDVTYNYLIREGSIMTSANYEKSLLSTLIIYEEVKNDISNHRYQTVGNDTLGYIEDRLSTRCSRLFENVYSGNNRRVQRLSLLKRIPDEIKQIIDNHWQTPTLFMKLMKMSFKYRCYQVFDALMTLSLMKNHEYKTSTSSCS